MKEEIPNGATHQLVINETLKKENQKVDYFKKLDGKWFFFNSKLNDWYLSVRCKKTLECVLERLTLIKQENEMIYTKQMYDAGELPKAGMKCNIFNPEQQKEVEVIILTVFDTKRGVGCVGEDGALGINVYGIAQVLPLKNKTDKEKAIDDIKNEITENFVVNPEITNFIFDAIETGKIHGVTYVNDSLIPDAKDIDFKGYTYVIMSHTGVIQEYTNDASKALSWTLSNPHSIRVKKKPFGQGK